MRTNAPAAAAIAGAIGTLVVVVTLVASCTLPGVEATSTSAPPRPSASADGADPTATAAPPRATTEPTAAPSASPAADLVPRDDELALAGAFFTTQNGTATFTLPVNWSAVDTSTVGTNYANEEQWVNQVVLVDEAGRERLHYRDGYLSDVGWGEIPWGVVEERAIARSPGTGELAARSWWMELPGGELQVMAAVTGASDGGPPNTYIRQAEGRFGVFSANLGTIEGCDAVADAASAEACLSSPAAVAAVAVLASLELHDVPWDAMP